MINRRSIVSGGLASVLTTFSNKSVRSHRKKYDVLVIGAGLSGLNSALLLEESGLNVKVIEGRGRVGGRVYTLMNIPGKPEAAGELIGGNYARMIDRAQSLDLNLVLPKSLGPNREWVYRIKDTNILSSDWPSHVLNPLSGDDRNILPHQLLFSLSHRNNPLSGKALDDWISPEFQKYDIPHSQYLKNYLGLNQDTINLMNVVIHTDHINNTSAIHELRRYAVAEFNKSATLANSDKPSSMQINGGNSLLPISMAESLYNKVDLNKTVYSFEDRGASVYVHCTDGSFFEASQVVCSIPYPVLKRVKFTPRLPIKLYDAIHEIDYGISIQVHFLVKSEFWLRDGLPQSIWTDGPVERFAVLNRGDNNEVSSAIAFINGNEAYKYDFMNDKEVAQYTLQELIKIRPTIKDSLEPILVQSCHREFHGGGDWVFWRPGQVKKYASNMRKKHGNIHFCGEHTALLERGMEGAFESGERVAFDVLEAMG
ncbi:MAG: NAD(P)/FAD-dependent oxidoreductase [Pseudomonadota bacterium]|nr:NAD(P)/FAD-dependent oxidoreductase [Pseudomonadota bacterium]